MNQGTKVLLATSGIAAPLVGGGIYAFWNNDDYHQGARDLPHQMELARQEGIELDASNLRRQHPLPASQNAAEPIRELNEEIKSREGDIDDLTGILNPRADPASALQRAEQALPSCNRIFALAAKAARRPDCDFERDYRLGPNLLFPEFAGVKRAIKALAAKAKIESKRGQAAESWQTLEQAGVLARDSGTDRCVISMLVQVACDSLVCRYAQEMLADQGGSAVAISGVRRVIRAVGPAPDVPRAFRSEFSTGLVTIGMMSRKKGLRSQIESIPSATGMGNPLALTPVAIESYQARFIEVGRELVSALPTDLDSWRPSMDVMVRIARREESDRRPSHFVNAIWFAMYPEILKAAAIDVDRRRLCLAGAAIYESRAAHGQFPTMLPTLGKEAADIMDGKPLRYRPQGKSFLLYSVGRDLVDDGGKPQSAAIGKSTGYDEVFNPLAPRT